MIYCWWADHRWKKKRGTEKRRVHTEKQQRRRRRRRALSPQPEPSIPVPLFTWGIANDKVVLVDMLLCSADFWWQRVLSRCLFTVIKIR